MKRITYPAACVLQALATGHSYGFDIVEATALPTGTVYPLLRRFEAAGLLESHWEDRNDAHRQGRPRRRHYRLTDNGHDALKRATARYRLHQAIFGKAVATHPDPSG